MRSIQLIKDKIKEEPEAKINLFHCLSELKEESLVQKVVSFVSSGRSQKAFSSPMVCSQI